MRNVFKPQEFIVWTSIDAEERKQGRKPIRTLLKLKCLRPHLQVSISLVNMCVRTCACTHVPWALEKERQEDSEFKGNPSCTGRPCPCLKTKPIILLHTESTFAHIRHTHCVLAQIQHTYALLPMGAGHALTFSPAVRLPVYTAQKQVPPMDQVRMFTKHSHTH